jgi:hypothetical protein
LILLELLPSKTPPITGVGKDAGKKKPSHTLGGNVS